MSEFADLTRNDSVEGGGRRPGRSDCECHYGPSSVHSVRRLGVPDMPDLCERGGSMHDGWFICGPCVRHAPQLRGSRPLTSDATRTAREEQLRAALAEWLAEVIHRADGHKRPLGFVSKTGETLRGVDTCRHSARVLVDDLLASGRLAAALAPHPDTSPAEPLRMSSDHPKARWHREEDADGRQAWMCVPTVDAMQAEWDARQADTSPSDAAPADPMLWPDVVKFVRWSANVRDDTAETIAVARALYARIEAGPPSIDPAWCDCGDEPRRGIAVGRHMTSCRYGIIEDYLGSLPRAEDPPAPVAPAGLDAAWAEAEAALPKGWRIAMLNLEGDYATGYSWYAVAEGGPDDWRARGYETKSQGGPTPAAALQALASALRAAGRTPVEPAP